MERLNENIDRLKALMQINETFVGNATNLAKKMIGIKSPQEKHSEILKYIESGVNPNMKTMYERLKSESPTKAQQYVQFFVQYPGGYTPVWDGIKFVPHGNRIPLGEEEKSTPDKLLTRLNAPEKHKINSALQKIMKQTYFPEIPLDEIFSLLKAYGLTVLQEDGTEWSGMLLGDNSGTMFDIGYTKSAQTDKSGVTFYTPIKNAGLSLTWYKMRPGRYEIVSYVS